MVEGLILKLRGNKDYMKCEVQGCQRCLGTKVIAFDCKTIVECVL